MDIIQRKNISDDIWKCEILGKQTEIRKIGQNGVGKHLSEMREKKKNDPREG